MALVLAIFSPNWNLQLAQGIYAKFTLWEGTFVISKKTGGKFVISARSEGKNENFP